MKTRWLIFISCFLSTLMPHDAMAAHFVTRSVSGSHVKLLTKKDPEFNRLISSHVGDVSARSDLHSLLTRSVLIKNETHHAIAGYSLRWTLTSSSGQVSTQYMNQVTPAAFNSGTVHKYGILPGDILLISFDRKLDRKALEALRSTSLVSTTLASQLDQQFGSLQSVEVALDGVFFEDGTFTGPNDNHLYEWFQAHGAAELIVATSIQAMLARGASQGEINNYLDATMAAAQRLTTEPTDVENLQVREAAAEAHRYRNLIDRKRVDLVANMSKQTAAQAVVPVRKVSQ